MKADRGTTAHHSKGELNAVAISAQSGDPAAAETLRDMMRPFVVSMTRSLDGAGTGSGYSREMSDELKQTIWEGVWIALSKFDPERGTKFSSYAYFWMRHEAHEWMSKNSRALPLPRVAWAQAIRLEEAYALQYGGDTSEASDEVLAGLVITDPKGGGERTVPHAGDILRAKRNAYSFDPEYDGTGQSEPAEAEYLEEAYDPDMDALETHGAIAEVLADTHDPGAEDAAWGMAWDFVDRHGLPDEVAEAMIASAEMGG